MKKILICLFILLVLSGCKKQENSCIFKDERNEDMKSYVRVTLISEDNIVEKERLYAVYKFKDEESASEGYSTIESVLEQESSVKIEQMKERLVAEGEKDVTAMKYDKEAKISYYEQLGYTCK